VLCRRWTALIVASLADGPLRFSELQDELQTISARTLTSRVRELEEIDLVDRVALERGSGPLRYQLTRPGRRPVIDEMRRLTPMDLD
jgi:DNA-binding HxlR family transcriptional regulator